MLGVLRDSAIGPMIKAVKLSIQNAPRKVSSYPFYIASSNYYYLVLATISIV